LSHEEQVYLQLWVIYRTASMTTCKMALPIGEGDQELEKRLDQEELT
jgi:hypothetical protein